MHNEVKVVCHDGQEFRFEVGSAAAMAGDSARQWLDAQFIELDCEPLRATGKVLTADKVLVVARAAGPSYFGNPEWGARFAQAAVAALGKPGLRVDVPAMALTY